MQSRSLLTAILLAWTLGTQAGETDAPGGAWSSSTALGFVWQYADRSTDCMHFHRYGMTSKHGSKTGNQSCAWMQGQRTTFQSAVQYLVNDAGGDVTAVPGLPPLLQRINVDKLYLRTVAETENAEYQF
jgi:hypothetical protein